jgi:hypothetical protein
MSEFLSFETPMPFSQLLDEALRWSRRHVRAIALPIAVPVCGAAGLMMLLQGFFFYNAFPAMGQKGSVPDLTAFFSAFAGIFLAALLLIFVQFLGYAAMIVAATEAVAGRPVSMGHAWRFVVGLRPFGTMLLAGVAVTVGMMCCLLPGMYGALILSMTLPVMVSESVYGIRALQRSLDLTQYNPAGRFTTDPRVKIFVMLFVGYLVGAAVGMIVQIPVMIVQQVLMYRMMGSAEGADPTAIMPALMAKMAWIQVPSAMISTFAQLLMHLYISFGLALLYFDLRFRKEGSDLETAIVEMGGPAPPSAP